MVDEVGVEVPEPAPWTGSGPREVTPPNLNSQQNLRILSNLWNHGSLRSCSDAHQVLQTSDEVWSNVIQVVSNLTSIRSTRQIRANVSVLVEVKLGLVDFAPKLAEVLHQTWFRAHTNFGRALAELGRSMAEVGPSLAEAGPWLSDSDPSSVCAQRRCSRGSRNSRSHAEIGLGPRHLASLAAPPDEVEAGGGSNSRRLNGLGAKEVGARDRQFSGVRCPTVRRVARIVSPTRPPSVRPISTRPLLGGPEEDLAILLLRAALRAGDLQMTEADAASMAEEQWQRMTNGEKARVRPVGITSYARDIGGWVRSFGLPPSWGLGFVLG